LQQWSPKGNTHEARSGALKRLQQKRSKVEESLRKDTAINLKVEAELQKTQILVNVRAELSSLRCELEKEKRRVKDLETEKEDI
jgi:ABC-type phosphate transport system auxiliary subunit